MTSTAIHIPTRRTRPENRLRSVLGWFRFPPRNQVDHFAAAVEVSMRPRAAKHTPTVEDVVERLDDWAIKQRAVTALLVEETARRRAQQDA